MSVDKGHAVILNVLYRMRTSQNFLRSWKFEIEEAQKSSHHQQLSLNKIISKARENESSDQTAVGTFYVHIEFRTGL
jgi:hypothetical protein